MRVRRSRTDRYLGGVCGGVASYLNMDATLVRIITVVATIFTGVPVVLYLVALFLMPEEDVAPTAPYGRVEQAGENFDWTDMVVTQDGSYCRLDIPYPKAAGPGGVFRIIGFTTPVDDTHCMVFFWRLRKVQGLAREVFRFMYRTTLEPRHWAVLEQDRVMLEGMPDDARKREMLYQHDIGVARIRQLLNRQAKAQIAAEDAALTRAAG